MTPDADATIHRLPAEPSDSRWTDFAQGVRRRLLSMTSQTIEVNQVTVRVVAAVAAFIAVAGTLVGVTVWLTNLSHRADAGAANEAAIIQVQKDISRLEGKIDALTGMSQQLSDLGAEVGSLSTRIDGQDRRLEMMDAWIQTTRERMSDQGVRSPDYRPGGQP